MNFIDVILKGYESDYFWLSIYESKKKKKREQKSQVGYETNEKYSWLLFLVEYVLRKENK